MATYLLRADDQDMARWKARAAKRGKPFSEHIRDCLEGDPAGLIIDRPVEAASSTGVGTSLSEAASTGGVSPVDTGGAERTPASLQVSPPVDLRQQARELAAKLQERVK